MNVRRWYLITGNVFVANGIVLGLLGYQISYPDCIAVGVLSFGTGVYSLYRGYSM